MVIKLNNSVVPLSKILDIRAVYYLVIVGIAVLILSGCSTMLSVKLNQNLIAESEATIIFYHEQGFYNEFPVFLDQAKPTIGIVTSEKPLKISVKPGEH